MSEMNPEMANAQGTWAGDGVGGLCLEQTPAGRKAPPGLPSSLQFARCIEALSPCLVERFRLCGINPPGAETMAREFTRKLATVFYALEIQPGAPDAAWALSRNCRKDMPLAYTMALHALLPDMVRLCAGGRVVPDLGRDGALPAGQGRRRLLVLAALVGCLTRLQNRADRPLSATENLARNLVLWAKRELAEPAVAMEG
jgi:hypothetical protein